MRSRLMAVLACAFTVLFLTAAPQAGHARANPLADAFAKAAAAYDVPRDLLVALAYAETHLDDHNGEPSASGGYGVMHLVSNPTNHSLERAAELTGLPVEKLRSDTAANIMGGAAVLRAHADELGLDEAARKDPGRWYRAVARYGGASDPRVARLYADAVFELLGLGIDAAGVTVAPQEVTADPGEDAEVEDLNSPPEMRVVSADCPPAAWVAAHSSNSTASSRPSSYAIDRVIIHGTQGSYAGTISWFQNSSSNVS